jgi:hypothetical protein
LKLGNKTLGLWVAAALLLAAAPIVTATQSGYELVCSGYNPQSNHKTVEVDCKNRKAFIDTLRKAWRTLRQNNIGGTTENLCWEAYSQAKDLHPSIGMRPDLASTFLMRCNMGLRYVQD